jgi:kynurenine 3-monooxygenase
VEFLFLPIPPTAAFIPRKLSVMAKGNILIVGAGPAGLAASLLLSERGYDCHVYDKAITLVQNDEESYPIGLNPRGLQSLRRIDTSGILYEKVSSETPISGWSIFKVDREVFSFPSGTTIGATRGGVTYQLYEEARKRKNISFHFGHQLRSINFVARRLTFQILESDETKEVDFSLTRVIGADGVWSKVRRELETAKAIPPPQLFPWHTSFRLLFSKPHPVTSLDPSRHYIFEGLYVAVIDWVLQKWVIAVQINDNDERAADLLGDQPTQENVAYLHRLVLTKSPSAASLIEQDEYHRFFSRRSFTGSVVQPSALNYEEIVVLLGDAAHAVNPATGEGVNSSLEDAVILADCFAECERKGEKNVFEQYNRRRLRCAQGLTKYAKYLLDGWNAPLSERVSRIVVMICLQLGKRFGLVKETWNDKSFGTAAADVQTYEQMYETWLSQTRILNPFASGLGQLVGIFSKFPSWFYILLLLLFIGLAVYARLF